LLLIDYYSRAMTESMPERGLAKSTDMAIKTALTRVTASPQWWKLAQRLAELTSAQPATAAHRRRLTVASVWSVAPEHPLVEQG
jgi:hypothetical protein